MQHSFHLFSSPDHFPLLNAHEHIHSGDGAGPAGPAVAGPIISKLRDAITSFMNINKQLVVNIVIGIYESN